MSPLPTFLVIGAMKAGTSALHDWLGRHPDCFVSARKELNYFATPELYQGIEEYAQHFADGATALARGESSPSYAMTPMYEGVPGRIAAVLPDVRIVYCVRDPLARIVSNHQHAVALGFERRSLDQAVREDPRYVQVSRYASQLAPYLDCFPRESVCVLPSEDLDAARVCAHVGLDPALLPPSPARVHVTADKQRVQPWAYQLERTRPRLRASALWQRATRTALMPVSLPDATRDWLVEQLAPDVEQLLPWLPAGHDGWGLRR